MLEYIPRVRLADYLRDGWRLIPGHEYRRGDWAIVMDRPANPDPMPAARIRLIVERFKPRCRGWSNKSQAASSRQEARQQKEFFRKLAQIVAAE